MNHATATRTVGATPSVVLALRDAHLGRAYAVRLRAQGVTWRLVLDGHAGSEELATGTIPAGTPTTVRVAGLPEVLGGTRLALQATTASGTTEVMAECSWLDVNAGCGPAPEGTR